MSGVCVCVCEGERGAGSGERGGVTLNNIFMKNIYSKVSKWICWEKARYFHDHFPLQCTPVINTSVLPIFRFLTNKNFRKL